MLGGAYMVSKRLAIVVSVGSFGRSAGSGFPKTLRMMDFVVISELIRACVDLSDRNIRVTRGWAGEEQCRPGNGAVGLRLNTCTLRVGASWLGAISMCR